MAVGVTPSSAAARLKLSWRAAASKAREGTQAQASDASETPPEQGLDGAV